MSIWEEVYARHKEGGSVPVDPQVEEVLSDSLGHQPKPADSISFEDMYYRTGKPKAKAEPAAQTEPAAKPEPAAQTEPVKQGAQDQDPKSQPQTEAPVKQTEVRFIPRITKSKLTVPYPAVLAKMRYSLSDAWANIAVETKGRIETLLFCGAARKEGVTLISYHLAMYLSKEYSMKVLYVDTNLNHTAIPAASNRPGLYSFVSEQKDIASLVVQTDYPGLYVLPSGAGAIAKNVSGNMLSREPIELLMNFCRNNFTITIIDGQPLTMSPVMIEVAKAADVTLLVCRYGYSRQEVSRLAIDKLQKFGVTSIGAILNDRQFPIPQKLYRILG
ncbi:MAG: hypothetical protein C0394_05410 [Syntrophus sp. (in: bacteria)]|nr:hypothetical protein [Syntrophus sp. (in: bacteria)]